MLLSIGSDASAHERRNDLAPILLAIHHPTVEKRFAWTLGTMDGR